MHVRGRIVLTLFLIPTIFSVASAQHTSDPNRLKSPLVLSVLFNESLPPNYHPLPDSSGFAYSRYQRIKSWQKPANEQPGKMVYVTVAMESEVALVRIAVLYPGNEGKVLGSHRLRENDSVVASELIQVGIEPFKISLIRVAAAVPPEPTLTNDTKGLEVVSVSAEPITLPSYQVTLRNISNKKVLAVMISVTVNGKPTAGAFLKGEEGNPLMPVGGLITATNLFATRPQETINGFSPAVPMAATINIGSAVYDDGSYEGNTMTPSLTQARVLGEKTFIRHLLKLIDEENTKENSPNLLSFRQRVMDHKFEVAEEDLKVAVQRSPPSALNPKSSSELTIRTMARLLLVDLKAFADTNKKQENFTNWLEANRQRYSAWLDRL